MRDFLRHDVRRWLLSCAVIGAGACAREAPPPPAAPVHSADRPAQTEADDRSQADADVRSERPRTDPLPSAPSSESLAASVVELALVSIGSPYRWGGTDGNGFDCSGLIQFAYAEHGIPLPRVSRDQIREGARVDPVASNLKPADILGFSRDHGGDISHVGLYIGDGEFIHSSTSGVRISTLSNPYWQARLVAARRVLD